jgi:ATP-dependent DNA helicase RecG
MAVRTAVISKAQADLVLAKQESHFFDAKAKEVRPVKLTKAISAFANADGGELYVGISEPAPGNFRWDGFARSEDANAHLQVFETLFPLGTDFDYTFLECEEYPGLVLQISIAKTQDIKNGSEGKPYLRRGPQSLPVDTPEKLRRLEYAKGISSFETEKTTAESDEVTNSTPVIDFMINVVPTAEPEQWLKKQQLLKGERVTVAGVLLFSDEPQANQGRRVARNACF